MAPSAKAHHRSHSVLLLQKLLNQRDGASPLTVVFDSLEQGARPLLQEFMGRAEISGAKVVYVSFETIKQPPNVSFFVKARRKPLKSLRAEIVSHCPAPATAGSTQRALIVIDSINPLAASQPQFLTAFLSTLVSPSTSVVAVYHDDVPLVLPPHFGQYEPNPVISLTQMATAILCVSNLFQAIEERKARDRSLAEPRWGLREGKEGVLTGLKKSMSSTETTEFVLEMELRRRSGRAVSERFIMGLNLVAGLENAAPAKIALLSDHPSLAATGQPSGTATDADGDAESTFNLGLTEKQRLDREGVVLPYFDAQTDIGSGEGGRILYEMGREDDFDDEEDEI